LLVEPRGIPRRDAIVGAGVEFDKIYKDLPDAGLIPPAVRQMSVFDAAIFGDGARSSLSTPEQRRAVQLFGWLWHREKMVGVVDLNDKNGPVHLDASVPSTCGTKLYMDLTLGKFTVMNPYHVLAAKGYKVQAYNLSVMPSRHADTMAETAVPMNVVLAFLLTCQKLMGSE
jgi:hypothetical protein